MPRYRITIEYDGTPFVGWQIQADGPSVQGALNEAIHRFSGETVVVKGAGRTDAGVHALGQVAHFDLAKDWDPLRVREALNFHSEARSPSSCSSAPPAESDFDARFSATARHYLYRILTRRAPPALDRNRVWWLTDPPRRGRHARGRARCSSATTISRPSAPRSARPSRRMRTLDRLDVDVEGSRFASRPRRAHSCTIRCARWSAA